MRINDYFVGNFDWMKTCSMVSASKYKKCGKISAKIILAFYQTCINLTLCYTIPLFDRTVEKI